MRDKLIYWAYLVNPFFLLFCFLLLVLSIVLSATFFTALFGIGLAVGLLVELWRSFQEFSWNNKEMFEEKSVEN
ncbi:MAG: hypothetical protein ACTSUQ_10585 [Candidatus Freyarchaeota archaeon]